MANKFYDSQPSSSDRKPPSVKKHFRQKSNDTAEIEDMNAEDDEVEIMNHGKIKGFVEPDVDPEPLRSNRMRNIPKGNIN
jgi:hypothetical protein